MSAQMQEQKKLKALRYLWQKNEQAISENNQTLSKQHVVLEKLQQEGNRIYQVIDQCEDKITKAFLPGSFVAPNDVMQINEFILGQRLQKHGIDDKISDIKIGCEKLQETILGLNIERRLLGEKIEQKKQRTIQMLNSAEYKEVEDLFLARVVKGSVVRGKVVRGRG